MSDDATPPQDPKPEDTTGEGNQRLCPNGHPVDSDLAFCPQCGTPLGTTCPAGHPNPPGYAYCGDCGAPLDGTASPTRPRWRRPLVAVLLGAIVLAAIVSVLVVASGDDSTPSAGPDTRPSTTTSTIATTTTTASTTTTTAATPTEPTLVGDGLGVIDFGASSDEVVAALSATFLGSPGAGGDSLEPDPVPSNGCPEPLYFQGLSLRVHIDRAGQFSGYDYQGPASVGLTTPEGVGYGSTLDELRSAYGDAVTVSGGSLGQSFTIRVDSGELRGQAYDSSGVAIISAGTTCT